MTRTPRQSAPRPSRDLPPLVLDCGPIGIDEVVSVARCGRCVELGARAKAAITEARAIVERAASDGEAHYGINTGFGSLSRTRIDAGQLRDLQRNLVRSHAAGLGVPLAADIVRGMMLILAASLARGHSGVRSVVVETILTMLNAGITPVVPETGSVGASGDLAPLAHVALVLMGEGEACGPDGGIAPGGELIARAGIAPLVLESKEGLALINGTHLMAARGALVLHDTARVFDAAIIAAAMSIDACRATDVFLDDRVHAIRHQPGQRSVARRVRELLAGSTILTSHRENDPRVQDPYSLRCIPQILGGAQDAIVYVRGAIERELGAVTDNPLVFPPTSQVTTTRVPTSPTDIVSAGNFHGMPLAIPLDVLAIAASHIAGVSERRTFLMLAAADPEAHLRPYLSPHPGVSSGLMIAQYTAAACCNEIVGLSMPASVSNITTSAGMEDYNSFGPRSAAKASRAIELTRAVVAIELLCAAQAIECHRPLVSGAGVERAHARIRAIVPALSGDRPPAPDIEAISALIGDGEVGL